MIHFKWIICIDLVKGKNCFFRIKNMLLQFQHVFKIQIQKWLSAAHQLYAMTVCAGGKAIMIHASIAVEQARYRFQCKIA